MKISLSVISAMKGITAIIMIMLISSLIVITNVTTTIRRNINDDSNLNIIKNTRKHTHDLHIANIESKQIS